MGPLDAFWHLLNFVAAPVGVGLLATAAAKLLWRRELAGVRFRRLAAWACAAGVLASAAGLLWFGRDGRIATYVALVIACAAALWWAGFVSRRR